jgi:TusA-related sulfurtransferase
LITANAEKCPGPFMKRKNRGKKENQNKMIKAK